MKMLERFEKRKYDKQEHVLASTSSKKARACVRDSPLSLSPFCTSESYKIEKRILKRKHFEILKQKHPKNFCNKGLHAIPNAINNINIPQVDFEISTDASDSEWVTYVVTPIGGFGLHLIMPAYKLS